MKQGKNMSLTNRIRFVMDMIADRWLLFALVVLMGCVSFLLVDVSTMMILEQRQTNLLAAEILTVDSDRVYQVSDANLVNVMHMTEQEAFEKNLCETLQWEQMSVYGIKQKQSFSELKESHAYGEMMKTAYAGTREPEILRQAGRGAEDVMYVYTANQNALDLFGIDLADISVEASDAITQKNYIPVYIGNDLKDILTPGQVLAPAYLDYAKVENPDGISLCNCYVAGVLDCGTKVLSDHYTGNDNIAICLDKMILIRNEDIQKAGYLPESEVYRNNLYMVFADKISMTYDLSVFMKKLRPLYERYDMKLSVTSLNDLISIGHTVEKPVRILSVMAVLLTIAGFMAFLTTSIVAVLLRKDQYGIMLANGVSHADLAFIVFMENLCKYALSLSAAFAIMHMFYAADQTIGYSGMDEYMSHIRMHLHYVLPIALLFMLAGVVGASVVPVHIVKKLSLMDLLRND